MSISNMYQERSYPIQLGEMLGEGYEVENLGVPGTMNNKESWFPYTGTENYKKALESNPDIVIMQLGTNDA